MPKYKVYIIFIIALLGLLSTCAFAEVKTSEMFNKTLKKIAQKEIKERVIAWVGQRDEITGIVAHDLIEHLLDNSESEQIIKSAIEVAGPMIFISEIRPHVENLLNGVIEKDEVSEIRNSIDITEYFTTTRNDNLLFIPNIKSHIEETVTNNKIKNKLITLLADTLTEKDKREILTKSGWSQEKLIAITSVYLYYYQRTREKNNFYVSPYISSFQETYLPQIKSIKIGNVPWTTKALKIVATGKKQNNNIVYDALSYEVFQTLLIDRISNNAIDDNYLKNKLVHKLITDYGITVSPNTKDAFLIEISNKLFSSIISNYKTSISDKDGDNAFSARIAYEISLPFISYISSLQNENVTNELIQKRVLNTLSALLQDWTQNSQNIWRFDYSFLLGMTYFRGDEQINATVIDQLKAGYFKKNFSFYAWGGGLLDPILRSIEGNSEKIYLLGLGGTIPDFNLSVFNLFNISAPPQRINWSYTLGLPDGKWNEQPRNGFTIGYRADLDDIEF